MPPAVRRGPGSGMKALHFRLLSQCGVYYGIIHTITNMVTLIVPLRRDLTLSLCFPHIALQPGSIYCYIVYIDHSIGEGAHFFFTFHSYSSLCSIFFFFSEREGTLTLGMTHTILNNIFLFGQL